MQQPFQTTLFEGLSLALQSFLPTKATRDVVLFTQRLYLPALALQVGGCACCRRSFRANASRFLLDCDCAMVPSKPWEWHPKLKH